MKINHNMMAVVTNAQLLKTEGGLSASMERLSSGIKINHAKDDPAGIAITNKMQSQIDGLAKASESASNGVSVLQIADSALGEITSMLQRMRELSVQAATDTNKYEERAAIQQEISSLVTEVDRISRDTEYNTKKLLDGSSDTRIYSENASRFTISDAVMTGNYQVKVTDVAKQEAVKTQAGTSSGSIPEGTVNINGEEVSIAAGEDAQSVYTKLRECARRADAKLFIVDTAAAQDYNAYAETGGYKEKEKIFAYGDTVAFAANQFGTGSHVDISCSNSELETFLGLNAATKTAGDNVKIEAVRKGTPVTVGGVTTTADSSFVTPAVTTDGNKIKITDVGGFEMNFVLDAGAKGTIDMNVTDIGTMTLQIGANEHQTMEVRIPEISSRTLFLDEVDVTKVNPGRAISVVDRAIAMTSSVRAGIGASQNRLEHAVESLDSSNEDMTNAISRILDTDMAKEMSEYTKYTVLQQAGTSVLAQANDVPQNVLQLLQ